MLSKLASPFLVVPLGLLAGSLFLSHKCWPKQSWKDHAARIGIVSVLFIGATGIGFLGYCTNLALCSHFMTTPWTGDLACVLLGTGLNAMPFERWITHFVHNPATRYVCSLGITLTLSCFGLSVMAPTIFRLSKIMVLDYAVIRYLLALTFVNWLYNHDHEDQTHDLI